MKNRWFKLGLGTLILLFLGLIYAWSVFKKPLSQLFPTWSATDLSLCFTISICCFCLGSLLAGFLSRKLKTAYILAIAAAFILAGFGGTALFLTATQPALSLTVLYLCYGACGGLGVGVAYNSLLSTILPWFVGKTGLASGVLLMGFGFGGLVLGSWVNAMSATMSLNNILLILGVLSAVLLLVGAVFIKKPEASTVTKAAQADDHSGIGTAQMLKRKDFYVFFSWLIIVGSSGLLIINSAVPIATHFKALPLMGLIVSLFNGGGRILLGQIFDRKGSTKAFFTDTALLITAAVSLIALSFTGQQIFLFIGLPLVGLSYGGTAALASAFTMQSYGKEHYASNFSMVISNLIPASLIGPTLASRLQDAGDPDYLKTFCVLAGLALIALLFNFVLAGLNKKSAA